MIDNRNIFLKIKQLIFENIEDAWRIMVYKYYVFEMMNRIILFLFIFFINLIEDIFIYFILFY